MGYHSSLRQRVALAELGFTMSNPTPPTAPVEVDVPIVIPTPYLTPSTEHPGYLVEVPLP